MAEPFFDFSGKEKSEQSVRNTWEELRNQLRDGVIAYDDREVITKNRFMSAINDIYSKDYGKQFTSKTLEQIENEYHLIRGSIIRPSEPFPDYDRMLPKSEFITVDNRFSPKGIEWLYLALGDKSVGNGLENAISCSQSECRAETGQQFAIWKIQCNSTPLQIIDLTIADQIPFERLESRLENGVQRLIQEEVNRFIMGMNRRSGSQIEQAFKELCVEWYVYAYSKILSDQLFIPVASADKELMYAPFHCVAQYFLSLGYSGIVYKSTVYDKGKNLVLFDKNIVKRVGDIDLRIIP